MKVDKDILARKLYGTLSDNRASINLAREAVDNLFDIITKELQKGNEVYIRNFGAMTPTEYKARNPVDTKKKKVTRVRFRPFIALKHALNGK